MSKKRAIWLMAAIIGILTTCGAAFGDTGPVAYWKLDEGMGRTACDWVGGNDGMLVGDANWVSGVIGAYGLEFDGAGDCVLCDTSAFGFADATFTVSAWFCTAAGGAIIAEGGYQHGGWLLHIHSVEGQVAVKLKGTGPAGNADAYNAITTETYDDGLWHHVVAVITTSTVSSSGNHADIYIDGCLANVDETRVYAYNPSSEVLSIGARGKGATTYFAGLLDDIILFDRPLSAEEIAAIYQDGLNGYGYPIDPKITIGMIEAIITEKEAIREKTEQLLNKEAEVCEVLEEALARGNYGDLQKGDIVKAMQKAQSAMQHEQQLIDVLSKSIEKLVDSLAALGWKGAPVPEALAW